LLIDFSLEEDAVERRGCAAAGVGVEQLANGETAAASEGQSSA
jgi:hypothetical protein